MAIDTGGNRSRAPLDAGSMDDRQRAQTLERAYAARAVAVARVRAAVAPAVGVRDAAVAGGVAVTSAVGGAGSSRAAAVGTDVDSAPFRSVSDGELDEIEDFFRTHGPHPTTLVFPPYAPPSLVAALSHRGYVARAGDDVVVRDGRGVGGTGAADEPGNADIVIAVHTASDVTVVAADVLRHTFPEASAQAIELSAAPLMTPQTRCFTAAIGGRVVGVGALSVIGDVAILAEAITIPAARGRGVHSALVRARVAAAARGGAAFTTSLVTPGTASARHLLRAGFRVAYAQTLFQASSSSPSSPSSPS